MPNTAPQIHAKSAGELRSVAIDCRGLLDVGELLTGAVTIAEVTTTDLTLTDRTVNTATLVINNVQCLAGQALTFLVAGGVVGRSYSLRATVGTTSVPAQTLIVVVQLEVIED